MVEATRAIYLDFEGLPHQAPSLLGWAYDGRWMITIIEEQLAEAKAWKVPGGIVTANTADAVLESIRSIAEALERQVCAWSGRALRIIKRVYVDEPEKAAWWEENLIDVRPQALWFVRHNRFRITPLRNPRTGHKSYDHQSVIMDALDIKVPRSYGRGVAIRGIKALRSALAEHGSIDAIDDETKQKWMATLLHNRYDCFGLAAIMCPVTRGRGQTLLEYKWVMNPYQGPVPTPIHDSLTNVPPIVHSFMDAWWDLDFFYGVCRTIDGGWAIAECSYFTDDIIFYNPRQRARDLGDAIKRANVENLAAGHFPRYDWLGRNW